MKHVNILITIIALLTSCGQSADNESVTEATEPVAVVEENVVSELVKDESQKLSDNEIVDEVRQLITKLNNFENHSYDLKEEIPITIVDLNKDGYNDAIAVISGGNTSGGNSWREDVAVFLNNPQTNKIKHYKDLNVKDDLNYKTIDKIELSNDGKFIVHARGYKDEDGQCCPSLPIKLHFGFVGNELKKAEEIFRPDKLIGKYRKWNADINQYDLIEVKKSKVNYEVDFCVEYPEELEYGACWSSTMKVKGKELYKTPTEDEIGYSIFWENGKLAVRWSYDNTTEYYTKF
ncbi:MAG: hypothetical protein M9958_05925 [Chitinophagales bacterium]|nr:hypothetical protein [Chitinophagales bacterium]